MTSYKVLWLPYRCQKVLLLWGGFWLRVSILSRNIGEIITLPDSFSWEWGKPWFATKCSASEPWLAVHWALQTRFFLTHFAGCAMEFMIIEDPKLRGLGYIRESLSHNVCVCAVTAETLTSKKRHIYIGSVLEVSVCSGLAPLLWSHTRILQKHKVGSNHLYHG